MSICTSLDLYFKMGPPMSENQVKDSKSRVASHHSPRRGMGLYKLCLPLLEKYPRPLGYHL